MPPDAHALSQWLSDLRGSRVSLRVAQRGDKRTLAETVERNAAEELTRHKLRRAGDLTARSAALEELQEQLGLDTAPLRIECTDVSHVQGSDVVASLVVFEDGLAKKADYRRYAIRGGAEGGDVAAIAEVVRRRFARYLQETERSGARPSEDETDGARNDHTDTACAGETSDGAPASGEVGPTDGPLPGIDPMTGRPRRFAYPPNLLVVDGGAPQVAAAAEVLGDLGVTDVAVVGLAKRLEEVWLPGEEDPAILPRNSEALYLLQRVRDEAHRFAITYHRQKRSTRMTASALDGVPGLGEARRAALLKHFGSVKKLRAASVEDVMEVPGVGRRTAEAVLTALDDGGTS
jgi:excinuclease ABC subunit C